MQLDSNTSMSFHSPTGVRAIILAAGQGTRLRPHTNNLPKCLVPIADSVTILDHQLRNCLRAGVVDVVVITGFQSEVIDAEIARWTAGHLLGIQVTTLFNPFWHDANNLISLWSARHFMDRGFILINGDDVFDSRILSGLCTQNEHAIYVCIDHKADYDSDDMKVVLMGDRVSKINKTMAGPAADGESIGIMKFSKTGAVRLQQELESMVRAETGLTDWYTKAIERIAMGGFPVGAFSVEGLPWAEVDFPKDLEYVRNNLAYLAA